MEEQPWLLLTAQQQAAEAVRCCSGPGPLTSRWTRSASGTMRRRCRGLWTWAPSRPRWTGAASPRELLLDTADFAAHASDEALIGTWSYSQLAAALQSRCWAPKLLAAACSSLQRLHRWGYTTPQEFADDMRLVFDNCRRYNAPDQEVVVMGNTLEVSRSLYGTAVQTDRVSAMNTGHAA